MFKSMLLLQYGITSFGCGFGVTTTVVAIVTNTGQRQTQDGISSDWNRRSLVGDIGGTIIQNALHCGWASLEYIDSLPDFIQTIMRSAYREVIFFVFLFAALLAMEAVFVGIVDKLQVDEEDVTNANLNE
ncbi:hypothetical protein K435DRAFT_925074 [Dendrothele bispora CBS 962.96]|uniref:Major facilitator superfamily (MFS) profile domain-containing protein n=1 Tax=Dendrothele bispora (strain CBS 962.96) TaxID=1314807 RepID=A0A4S8MVA0_DENBC|nr:hypothetical protein K435DRAFT_925074 [Dendrothele bispora CBS 962.96]